MQEINRRNILQCEGKRSNLVDRLPWIRNNRAYETFVISSIDRLYTHTQYLIGHQTGNNKRYDDN